jgi:hypothetical protein
MFLVRGELSQLAGVRVTKGPPPAAGREPTELRCKESASRRNSGSPLLHLRRPSGATG